MQVCWLVDKRGRATPKGISLTEKWRMLNFFISQIDFKVKVLLSTIVDYTENSKPSQLMFPYTYTYVKMNGKSMRML